MQIVKSKNAKFSYEKYTITGLYSVGRIKNLIEDEEKMRAHAEELKQIIKSHGTQAIFSPVISRKALNKETVEAFLRLQLEAGLETVSLFEGDIHQNEMETKKFFEQKIKQLEGKKIIPFLSLAMQGEYLLSKKLKILKTLGFGLVNVSFTGYKKYRDNLLLVLGSTGNNFPEVLISCAWNKVGRTSCPILLSLYNPRYVSSGYKWGASKKQQERNIEMLNERKIEFDSLSRKEKNELKTELQISSEQELFDYIRRENFIRNQHIIERLIDLDEESLKKLIEENEALKAFF